MELLLKKGAHVYQPGQVRFINKNIPLLQICDTYHSASTSEELITDNLDPSTSTFEKISESGSLLAWMRRHVMSTPGTVFENQRTSYECRTFTKHQRRLLRQLTYTNLIGTILFEIDDRLYAHWTPQSSRRIVMRPGNYIWLASVVDWCHYGVRSSINLFTPLWNSK